MGIVIYAGRISGHLEGEHVRGSGRGITRI